MRGVRSLSWILAGLLVTSATSADPLRRVPAEFEAQEALWLQWPGPFEQTYVPAFAKITNVVVR